MKQEFSEGFKREFLSKVELPDQVLGETKHFKNYDPARIQYFDIVSNGVHLYMNEIDRIQAMEEFKSTIEAFRYEVERGVRPEVQAYSKFEYDSNFQQLIFYVKRVPFEQDVTTDMIERSIVEDCIRFQVYSRKPIGVEVVYIDVENNERIIERIYPKIV